jgi:hypothetical protein
MKWKTEERLQKYVRHSLTVCYSVYTSLHVFNLPDQGKAVGKLLKHLMSTLIKKGIDRKKISMPRGFVHNSELALCNIYIISMQHSKVLATITAPAFLRTLRNSGVPFRTRHLGHTATTATAAWAIPSATDSKETPGAVTMREGHTAIARAA